MRVLSYKMLIFRSVCYLEWTEGNGEEYFGTGFLMKTIRGFMFVSAGHNFRDGKEDLVRTKFKRYNMMFNNPKGLSYKNKTNDTIHLNLQKDFLDRFDFTLAICDSNNIFFKEKKNGKHVQSKTVEGRPHADFMALTISDTAAFTKFLKNNFSQHF